MRILLRPRDHSNYTYLSMQVIVLKPSSSHTHTHALTHAHTHTHTRTHTHTHSRRTMYLCRLLPVFATNTVMERVLISWDMDMRFHPRDPGHVVPHHLPLSFGHSASSSLAREGREGGRERERERESVQERCVLCCVARLLDESHAGKKAFGEKCLLYPMYPT